MKTDAQLQADVRDELAWDPSIQATHVGVAVQDGVVTLTGHLDTFAEKSAVERAVLRVRGVRALAIELDVKLAPDHQRSDSEIAQAAEAALQWHAQVPPDRVRLKVEKGWVWLAGELDWEFQRQAAQKAIRTLVGVVGVHNGITLKPTLTPAHVKLRIHDALARHAEREARNIEVRVDGATVTLRGRVDTWADRAAVQGAVWSAPGIGLVVNELTVGSAP